MSRRPLTGFDRATALVVVDVQNDFAGPRGSLYVSGGEEIIEPIDALIEAARASGATVVYPPDWHPAVTPHFAKDRGVWPVHCVKESWGAELYPGLTVEGEVVRKRGGGEDAYSGFSVRDPTSELVSPTPLEDILRSAGVARVVVVGLATDYCVKETALDAPRLGFDTTVLTDAVRAVNLEPGDGDRAVAALAEAGASVR